jgi:hypothetical protein
VRLVPQLNDPPAAADGEGEAAAADDAAAAHECDRTDDSASECADIDTRTHEPLQVLQLIQVQASHICREFK